MSPNEKAKSLIEKFKDYAYVAWNGGDNEMTNEEAAKECAIVLCDEMIDYISGWDKENEMEFNEDGGHVDFWEAVKVEINEM